ncbi:MAG TPA: VWA domain-containing protein [Polyangiales bacterium]
MFVPFLYALRERKVPVGAQEAVSLAKALMLGLHEDSLDGFYYTARAICVHNEAHLDAFDDAFLSYFKGVERGALELKAQIFEWLKEAKEGAIPELTEEERKLFEQFDLDQLREMFEERLRDQKERHDGGNKWIGTGGKSPFGHSGAPRPGIRVGGAGGNRSAIKVAGERAYRGYRDDLTLDTRQAGVALRKLRAFIREGAEEELDLEGTIDATAKNAGELDVKVRPPRRPNTRVILMMDVGGSMDPYTELCSRLFSAASKATHFKELRSYYFHNAVYGHVYKDARFQQRVSINDLIHECGPHYKLICVGDGLMSPYELLAPNGSSALEDDESKPGIWWFMQLQKHFTKSCWLNPEAPNYWSGNTIEHIRSVFEMFPLTVNGLGEAVQHLIKGKPAGSAR